MGDLDRLKQHLENLKKAGHKEFNINVEWLLSALSQVKDTEVNQVKNIELDGGKF